MGDSVTFRDTELKFGVLVAKSHAQTVLWVLADPVRSLFKTLASKAVCDMHCFKECYIY